MSFTKVIAAEREAAVHLDRIAAMFKPGVKLTLIVRTPGNDEADFTMSDDDLLEVVKVLERRMAGDVRRSSTTIEQK